LIVWDSTKRVGPGLARLHQDVDPLPGRHQHGIWMVSGLIRLARYGQAHARQRDAVAGDRIERMPLQIKEQVVLPASMQHAPALHLARPYGDGRFPHAVHGEEARRCFREKRSEILNHAEIIEDSLSQHEQPLLRGCDLRNVSEIALDDQRADSAARDLHVGRSMRVRVIPIGPRDMVGGYGDLDVVALARFHHA
jgi:hypothetical protein